MRRSYAPKTIRPTKAAILDAVSNLDLRSTKALLDAKPVLLAVRDRQDRNLLQLACSIPPRDVGVGSAAQLRLVDYLLTQGFALDEQAGRDKCTALFFAVARARNPKLVEFLIRRGAQPAMAPGGGLFAGVWWQDVKSLGLLLDAGAPIDVVVGVTPFLAAWISGRFRAAKFLALRGADLDAQDHKGRTALHHAIEREFDPALLRWLVKHGASPDVRDRQGVSARDKASRKRDQRFFRALGGVQRSPDR